MNALTPKFDVSRADQRKETRASVLKSAKIVFGGSWGAVVDCLVLNLSAQGAHLETILTVDIPETFCLRFSDGTQLQVRQRWNSGHQIGVEFTDSAM
ncbi:hypothetical protein [Acidocella aminolytica]|jgi:hypothetical protein|uniref:PilZ domain-containing protein n=1 Tax=Acidocella aminolytica 101 = DSM 11237 TaxID=1120923 RepID=A0A0D6PKG9_9PROT|nr:hypothetical protein [Acidocella aminolytica]GAN81941.1 hypothetical protein Aam_127_020 [Acidocella aminolytica 101 = DSM 11237]GBQ38558.1 hypothetical protein AA11237_1833 [Acidocella aminolytica 101 = DSM 11237]SHE76529.1 hypothetical protein SAMN02746095_01152 [Acidocella aminolytica 101 = DSM 11237]